MDNRTTFIVLLATIFITLGGTFLTLNELAETELQQVVTTGYATSDTGQGRIQIAKSVSIQVNTTGGINIHDDIDFGSCTPFSGHIINLSSNASNGGADSDVGAYGNCTGEAFPDYIHVYNVGNTDANVTIQSSLDSDGFIASPGNEGLFAYITTDGNNPPSMGTETHAGGCKPCTKVPVCAGVAEGNVNATWAEFVAAATEYPACNNLTYARGAGEKPPGFKTFLLVQIPTNAFANGAITSTLTYTAAEVT
jgi:hypothetical protein